MSDIIRIFTDNPQGAFFFVFAVLVAAAFLVLSRRISLLTKGKSGKSLEGTIEILIRKVEALEANAKAVTTELADKERRIARSVQAISVKRFDPFQNAGGLQSFATALLDERGNGAVISGIHARDGVRVYAKPLSQFASERELSEDETGAIDEAKKKLS